jgi:hypothetical protein
MVPNYGLYHWETQRDICSQCKEVQGDMATHDQKLRGSDKGRGGVPCNPLQVPLRHRQTEATRLGGRSFEVEKSRQTNRPRPERLQVDNLSSAEQLTEDEHSVRPDDQQMVQDHQRSYLSDD